MKELNLVPSNLFNKKYIESILLENSNDESAYYKAILQNLFFATLSTPKEQRRFTDETRHIKGHNDDFGNQNVFRFHEFYKNPEHIKSYFEDIPFLNGGLFECLDISRENQYVDGFTRRKQYQAHVPDFLFFSGEREANLNPWYDTKGKKYVVKGLLEILSAYNFTVDENTADDADIALDPELLGKVFENLLASFNPETSTTARKATGSFYTPREIVDYMVTESLKEYFKTHLKDTEDIENKLESLFNHALDTNPFIDGSRDTKNLVNLIENVRIVDPAVGSGAFPMGILNKLVFILNKIDKGNKLWKDAQLKSVENIQDSRLREETRGHIENYFKNKNPDYGRKLYLIQRCIYGVDIQQIAVEISKLRFFISLLVDEKIDKTKENWGIEPLPNLDFKIMQGNSLLEEYEGIKLFDESLFENKDIILENQLKSLREKHRNIGIKIIDFKIKNIYTNSLEAEYEKKLSDASREIESFIKINRPTEIINDMFDNNLDKNQKRDTLNRLHKDFFDASRKEQKDKIKLEIEKLEWELIESTLISQGNKSKLDELNKIRKSNSKPFFLWKLQFADVFEKGGFDIVIGNPPYGILNKKQNKAESIVVSKSELDFYKNNSFYEHANGGMLNIYRLFIFKSISLLNFHGVFSEIFPLAFIGDISVKNLRSYILHNNQIIGIEAFPERDDPSKRVFEAVKMSVCILILKRNQINTPFFLRINNDRFVNISKERNFLNQNLVELFDKNHLTFPLTTAKENSILYQIYTSSIRFSEIGKCNTGEIDMTFCKNYFTSNNSDARLIKGAIIDRYIIKSKMSQGDIVFLNEELLLRNKQNADKYKNHERIVLQGITGVNEKYRLKMMIVNNVYCANSLNFITLYKNVDLQYLLGVFNSKLLNFVFKKFSTNSNVNGYEVDNLPIIINDNYIWPIRFLVDKLLDIYNHNGDPTLIEQIIDALIYELYLNDIISTSHCNIVSYFNQLNKLKSSEKPITNSSKVNLLDEFLDKRHPIYKDINKIKQLEEIKIIESC